MTISCLSPSLSLYRSLSLSNSKHSKNSEKAKNSVGSDQVGSEVEWDEIGSCQRSGQAIGLGVESDCRMDESMRDRMKRMGSKKKARTRSESHAHSWWTARTFVHITSDAHGPSRPQDPTLAMSAVCTSGATSFLQNEEDATQAGVRRGGPSAET